MNWPNASLAQLARMVGGGTPSKKNDAFWNGGSIPWVSPKDMNTREIRDAEDHITDAAVDESATQVVPAGSVLVVVRSGILVRRFPIAVARVPVALNQDMKALLPGGPLSPECLAYALESRADYVLSACVKRGATVHSIDIGKFSRLQLPVPPPSEQRRIVEILDQAVALCRLRSAADAKEERILPALFLKMFGDPGTNPKGLPAVTLGTVIARGPQNGLYKPASAYGSGTRILRIDGFYSGQVTDLSSLKRLEVDQSEIENYGLEKDDIVINRVNSEEYLGKSAIVPELDEPVVFESNMMRLSVDRDQVLPLFVIAHLQTPFTRNEILRKAKRAINQASINQQDVRAFTILKPPRQTQERFASMVVAASVELKRADITRHIVQSLFEALLGCAFSGDLTSSWREAHAKELVREMERQARELAGSDSGEART